MIKRKERKGREAGEGKGREGIWHFWVLLKLLCYDRSWQVCLLPFAAPESITHKIARLIFLVCFASCHYPTSNPLMAFHYIQNTIQKDPTMAWDPSDLVPASPSWTGSNLTFSLNPKQRKFIPSHRGVLAVASLETLPQVFMITLFLFIYFALLPF